MVGGFDFHKNKFNHVTQAWRQPGSGFKPFIYSAALEKGFTPATIVNDAPLFFDAGVTGGQPWEPKNYDGKFEGPMPLHTALAKSKNMVSIRILQAVGTQNAQDWITRFGFEPEKHPAYLTMALGAGSVTPMQMATGYAVFANGGYRVNPWLVTASPTRRARCWWRPAAAADRIHAGHRRPQRLRDGPAAARSGALGTAASAAAHPQAPDLYGKTGTTNDSIDTWFNGFHPSLVAIVWMGYDNPRSLGDRETGGGLSLPVWINFMETALKGVPGDGARRARRRGEHRRRVVLRGIRARQRRQQPGRDAGARANPAHQRHPAPPGTRAGSQLGPAMSRRRTCNSPPAAAARGRGPPQHPGPVPN
jgi:penicillin-binding protein 1A